MGQSQIIHVTGETVTAFLDPDDDKQLRILSEATDPYELQTAHFTAMATMFASWVLESLRVETPGLAELDHLPMNLLYRSMSVIDPAARQGLVRRVCRDIPLPDSRSRSETHIRWTLAWSIQRASKLKAASCSRASCSSPPRFSCGLCMPGLRIAV